MPAWWVRPASDGPLDAVAGGLDAAAAMLGEGRRDLTHQRYIVIAANPELRERELAKLADYAAAVARALHHRGVGEPQASLAAELGMTVLARSHRIVVGRGRRPGARGGHAAVHGRATGGGRRRLSDDSELVSDQSRAGRAGRATP